MPVGLNGADRQQFSYPVSATCQGIPAGQRPDSYTPELYANTSDYYYSCASQFPTIATILYGNSSDQSLANIRV